jgi:hypothetical protein
LLDIGCSANALVAPPLANLSANDFSAAGFLALLLSQAVLLLQIVSPWGWLGFPEILKLV